MIRLLRETDNKIRKRSFSPLYLSVKNFLFFVTDLFGL